MITNTDKDFLKQCADEEHAADDAITIERRADGRYVVGGVAVVDTFESAKELASPIPTGSTAAMWDAMQGGDIRTLASHLYRGKQGIALNGLEWERLANLREAGQKDFLK